MSYTRSIIVALFSVLILGACSTTRSKEDVKGLKKLYTNTTAKFNGYFNANELMKATMLQLQGMHQDNYNNVLSVYDYIDIDNPQSINPDMDKAIEKVMTVAALKEFSNYVDDCYVMIGKAQYLKQDYASAEETFQYFEDEFDPKNPYGREYIKAKSEKLSPKERKKKKEKERKEAEKERKKEEEARKKEREAEQKEREEARKKKKKSSKKKKGKRLSREERAKQKAAEEAKKKQEEARKEAERIAAEKKAAEEKYAAEKEKLKKEEEEKKKKEERPQGEGAVWKNKTAYYKGLYWLARTYIERDRFSSAHYVLDRLESVDPLEGDVRDALPAARAHLYMRSGENDKALVELENAINAESKRKNKARYAFIKAQLYEKDGATTLAYSEYKRAKKYSPDYGLKFNAELNEMKLSYRTGGISKDKALSKLENLQEDIKNVPYLDQIYFTMAQIKLDAKDVDGAIADFENAIAQARGNKNVQLEAYVKLADLLFEQGHYAKAKQNYDKAFGLMKITDPRYKRVRRLANNLTDIARNMNQLELQDSLLRLALRSDEDLADLARTGLAERDASLKEAAETANEPGKPNRGAPTNFGSARSSFFAYNPIALNQGKADFRKKWGDRVLEDNWRRSLRADANFGEEEEIEEEPEERVYTDKEIEEFLREVPRTQQQKDASHVKIQNALFQLGVLFRDRLRDFEKSADMLERLVREYPKFERRDEALFYLYLTYLDLGRTSDAQEVSNKLNSEFPDSKFTKLANDPNYALTLKNKETNIAAYYDRTYKLFQNEQYKAVLERVGEKAKLFKKNPKYDPKFALLQAMSLGKIEGKDRYIQELEHLVRKYKKTPEEVRAREILRFLKGDEEAFDEILYDEALDKFTLDDLKRHYIFVVVYGQDGMSFEKTKIAISEYNKKYHRGSALKISDITLSTVNKSDIILIRSFDNKVKAMTYYDGVKKNESDFINKEGQEVVGYDIFACTQKNYREVIKQKSVAQYRKFFEAEYLRER